MDTGKAKSRGKAVSWRTLQMKALPASDWYLYTQLKDMLQLRDMRDVFVLGLRYLYGNCWDDDRKKSILQLANNLLNTDLDHWKKDEQPTYEELS